MRPSRLHHIVILAFVIALSGCATGPAAEREASLWRFLSDMLSSNSGKTVEKPAIIQPAEVVEDPAREELAEPQTATSGVADVPIVGPLLVAILGADPPLPEDEEVAVEAQPTPGEAEIARLIEGDSALDKKFDDPGDIDPPNLKILYLRRGRLHAYGSRLTIRGRAEDASGIEQVKINGQRVTLKVSHFSKTIQVPVGEHPVLIEAVDTEGNRAFLQFTVVRRSQRQSRFRRRNNQLALALDPEEKESEPVPSLRELGEPGVYMVLMKGTASMHIVKMPSLRQCREAVAFSDNAACTYHSGR